MSELPGVSHGVGVVSSKGQLPAMRPVYLLGAKRAKRNLRTVKVWAQHLCSDVTAFPGALIEFGRQLPGIWHAAWEERYWEEATQQRKGRR